MDDKTKKDFKKVINEELKRTVKPEITKLDKKVDSLGNRVDRLDDKVDKLDKKVENMGVLFVTEFGKVYKRIDSLEEKVESRDDAVFNRLDMVVKEVKAMREEQAAHQVQHEDINKRLEVIEAVPVVAHEIKNKK